MMNRNSQRIFDEFSGVAKFSTATCSGDGINNFIDRMTAPDKKGLADGVRPFLNKWRACTKLAAALALNDDSKSKDPKKFLSEALTVIDKNVSSLASCFEVDPKKYGALEKAPYASLVQRYEKRFEESVAARARKNGAGETAESLTSDLANVARDFATNPKEAGARLDEVLQRLNIQLASPKSNIRFLPLTDSLNLALTAASRAHQAHPDVNQKTKIDVQLLVGRILQQDADPVHAGNNLAHLSGLKGLNELPGFKQIVDTNLASHRPAGMNPSRTNPPSPGTSIAAAPTPAPQRARTKSWTLGKEFAHLSGNDVTHNGNDWSIIPPTTCVASAKTLNLYQPAVEAWVNLEKDTWWNKLGAFTKDKASGLVLGAGAQEVRGLIMVDEMLKVNERYKAEILGNMRMSHKPEPAHFWEDKPMYFSLPEFSTAWNNGMRETEVQSAFTLLEFMTASFPAEGIVDGLVPLPKGPAAPPGAISVAMARHLEEETERQAQTIQRGLPKLPPKPTNAELLARAQKLREIAVTIKNGSRLQDRVNVIAKEVEDVLKAGIKRAEDFARENLEEAQAAVAYKKVLSQDIDAALGLDKGFARALERLKAATPGHPEALPRLIKFQKQINLQIEELEGKARILDPKDKLTWGKQDAIKEEIDRLIIMDAEIWQSKGGPGGLAYQHPDKWMGSPITVNEQIFALFPGKGSFFIKKGYFKTMVERYGLNAPEAMGGGLQVASGTRAPRSLAMEYRVARPIRRVGSARTVANTSANSASVHGGGFEYYIPEAYLNNVEPTGLVTNMTNQKTARLSATQLDYFKTNGKLQPEDMRALAKLLSDDVPVK